jgi:hypothetical protein
MAKLSSLSVTALQAELRRRERVVGKLQKRHPQLEAKLNTMNRQIAALGGSVNGHIRSGRPRNALSLIEALAAALKDKTMSVGDAAKAVQQAGYRTNSNNFRTQVNIALIKGPFKRVGRGEYTAK